MKLPAACLASLLALAPPALAEGVRTIIVMDGSGSMWGQIDGQPKLQIARAAVAEVVSGLPPEEEIGVMAYGHRVKGDCSDIELLVPPAAGNADAVIGAVNAMRFLGKTPLSEAVRQAAEELRYAERAASVVLVTDGLETCGSDPCALARELEASGVDFTAHVIGFGLSAADGAEVACIAEETGGRFLQAGDAGTLSGALRAVVGNAPPAEAPPPPDPDPILQTNHFPGAWLMPQAQIMPTGRSFGPSVENPASIAFPADGTIETCQATCAADALCGSWQYEPPGSYFVAEARCRLFSPATEFGMTFAAAEDGFAAGMKEGVIGLLRPYVAIGATDIPVTLTLPEPAIAGAEFVVQWSGPAGVDDWVDLVPAGQAELGGELSIFWVNETIEDGDLPEGAGVLVAPTDPGRYDLRYVLGRSADQRVIHRLPLMLGEGGLVPISAPAPAQDLPRPVPVSFTAEGADAVGLAISWSATPEPGQDLPPEAWALPDAAAGTVTADFLPGRYAVQGDAGDSVFAANITVTPQGPNAFTIPADPALSPAGPDADPGTVIPVTIRAEGFDGVVEWSAMPDGGTADDRIGDRLSGPWSTTLDPGDWAVFGMSDDATFFARIRVDAASSDFTIPREMPVPTPPPAPDRADPAALAERLNGIPLDLGRIDPAEFERLLGLRP